MTDDELDELDERPCDHCQRRDWERCLLVGDLILCEWCMELPHLHGLVWPRCRREHTPRSHADETPVLRLVR